MIPIQDRSEVELFKLTAEIPKKLFVALKVAAVEDGRPLRELVTEAIEKHLKERKKERRSP